VAGWCGPAEREREFTNWLSWSEYQRIEWQAMGMGHQRKTGARHSERNRLIAAARSGALSEPTEQEVELGRALLGWFARYGRTFYWRCGAEPYEVLVAEILLRKTTSQAVELFLAGFLDRYSDARRLAESQVEDLAEALAPLGLNVQRASQLYHLGRFLDSEYGGSVPTSTEDLLRLPGVGPYTASMMAATCGWEAIPAVDTNVARILMRVFSIVPTNLEARKSPEVWEAAGRMLHAFQETPAAFNWALLDFGALVCTARRPKCLDCPLQAHCTYFRSLQQTGAAGQ
jgi:A/G-specific adenine glycosylase